VVAASPVRSVQENPRVLLDGLSRSLVLVMLQCLADATIDESVPSGLPQAFTLFKPSCEG
jgi:hypothetical protein